MTLAYLAIGFIAGIIACVAGALVSAAGDMSQDLGDHKIDGEEA